MIDEVPMKKWACICVNKDFIEVETRSGYRMTFADASQKSINLPLSAVNIELGRHLREAINLSRRVHPINDKELDLYLYHPDRYKEWLELTMKKFGYKTKAKMFKPMLYCNIEAYQGIIYIKPLYQRALDGWDRSFLTEADDVIMPETCTDEELGAAARLALSRCRSRYGSIPGINDQNDD